MLKKVVTNLHISEKSSNFAADLSFRVCKEEFQTIKHENSKFIAGVMPAYQILNIYLI